MNWILQLSISKSHNLNQIKNFTHYRMMPRFMKRNKTPDYKDRTVFGVPLLHNLQKTGHPLPQTIMYAMRYLRRTAHDAVGIFRKPGVRSRIQQLKKMNEANPGMWLIWPPMIWWKNCKLLKSILQPVFLRNIANLCIHECIWHNVFVSWKVWYWMKCLFPKIT